MNSKKPPLVDEHEWERQERGMHAARECNAAAMDATADSYRRVAMAVTSAPHREPPADFAAAVVAKVANRDAGVERALWRGLVLVLAASSVIVPALYADQWWQAMQGMLSGGASQWLVVGTGCVALSWLLGQLRPFLPGR